MIQSVAQGRVNLIGEHTDYNGGWVLPTTIPQSTTVKLTSNASRTVNVSTSKNRKGSYQLGTESKTGTWIDYLQGATQLLAQAGYKFSGFDAVIDSKVPEGSGLSSSAALEVAFLKSIRQAFDLEITDIELAKLAQRIENEFVGARVGIMDQMACSLARAGEALFLDTQSLTFENVVLPLGEIDLIVVNSGISHRNAGGDYNTRRSECEQACALIGIRSLRELGIQDLSRLSALPGVLMKRARHVITENQRVFDAVSAIKSKDWVKLGKLFYESHVSQRDDYAVSIPEIDLLVELCLSHPEIYGARLTGGGFGGSIVAIAVRGTSELVMGEVMKAYSDQTGEVATRLV